MKNHLNLVKSLKGLGCAIIAFLFHYGHFVDNEYHPLNCCSVFYWLCNYGWMVVECFFFLSGVTFMTLFATKIREGNYPIEKYTIDRLSKLYPIHFITLIVVAITQMIRTCVGLEQFKFVNNDFGNFFLNVMLFQSFVEGKGGGYNWVAWTLSINVLLYMIFYLICKKTKSDFSIFIISLLLFCFGLELVQKGTWAISSLIGRGLAPFFFGVMFVILYNKTECKKDNDIKGACLAILAFEFCVFTIKLFGTDINNNIVFEATINTVTFLTLGIIIISKISFLEKILCSKPFMFLGSISFSLFMVHYPIQTIMVTINDIFRLGWDYSRIGFFVAYVLICLVTAYLTHIYIESYFSKTIRQKYYDNFNM